MRRSSTYGLLTAGCALALTAAARADVDAWYELVDSSGPGNGVVSFTPGGPGQPLIITTDSQPGTYQLTIQFVADFPAQEGIIAYALNLIAPASANVAVTSLTFLGSFDVQFPVPASDALGPAPGVLIFDAAQFSFVTEQSGTQELLEFVLTVERPPAEDVELFSGIGASNWATSSGDPVLVRYADADPLDGGTQDLVSSTPSIVIKQFVAPPPATGACCLNGATCNTGLTQADCQTQSGVWQGDNSTTCVNCPPPPTGACCLNGATCNTGVTQTNCEGQSGVWQGAQSTSCANCPPPPTGACCLNGTTCNTGVTQTACETQGGVWQGAGTTTCANCPPPTGACCINGVTCNTGVTQTDCEGQGGTWQGADSTTCQNCSPTSQPTVTTTQPQETTPPDHVDRAELRKKLIQLFYLPIEGNEPIWLVPVNVLGFLGMNVSFGWAVYDLLTLPYRFIALEILFSILDHTLP